jgi:hypothetical protein
VEEERLIVQIDRSDFEELKREIRRSKTRITGVIVLLFLIVVALGYLTINMYRENNASDLVDSTRRILMVSFVNDSDKVSDETQVKNALTNGGMIQLQINGTALRKSFGSDDYKKYGASDYGGSFYIIGAALNYISSRGWTLVQSPTTGLMSDYYFIR